MIQQQPINNQMQSQEQMPPEVQNIEYNTNESKMEGILNKLKKPILISSIVFIIFNPIVLNSLATYLPRVFGLTDNIVMRQVKTLILALAVGLIYFGSNLIM